MNRDPTPHDPRNTLVTLRVIWALVVAGGLLPAVTMTIVVWGRQGATDPRLANLLFYISVALFLVLTPLGYFARNQFYKSGWRGHAITPAAYFQGNVVLLALLEGPAIASAVSVLVAGEPFPALWPAVGALLVQIVNFPSGKPMRPHAPGVAAGEHH